MNKPIVSGILLIVLLLGTLSFVLAHAYYEVSESSPTNAYCGDTVKSSVSAFGSNEWPMVLHYLNHTGYSTSTAPSTNARSWETHFSTLAACSGAAVAYGKVYVHCGAGIYCLDAFSGAIKWTYTTFEGTPSDFSSSPAVADDRVYVGSCDGNVTCLQATTGGYVWNYTTGGAVHSSPVVADGKVYVGSDDFNVYCLDASTGHKNWNRTLGNWVRGSPAVWNGLVYIGAVKFYCLNASTGVPLWSYTGGEGAIWSSPNIAYPRVFYVAHVSGSEDNNLYCLDTAGYFKWSRRVPVNAWGSCAVAYGRVYVGGDDGLVYCYEASNGTLRWTYPTGGPVWSTPAVADGKVYFGSRDDYVYCFNASTTDLIWRYDIGGIVESPLAIAYGRVYVGSYMGSLGFFAFGPPAVHDVAVTDVQPSKRLIVQNKTITIAVTVVNQGEDLETNIEVTAYVNTTAIQTLTIPSLAYTEQTTLTFTWNTTTYSKGIYTISATAATVPLETDTTDNTKQLTGVVTVVDHIPGDINRDGVVDISDAAQLGMWWTKYVPPAPAKVDINGDGFIDISDAAILGMNWGQHA